jgi:hypothetical protein
MYAGDVAARRGARVHRHSWSAEPPSEFAPALAGWVCGEIGPTVAALDGRPLLIGKSLGTLAAELAVERSLPAVWLTPLLSVPWAVAPLDRATAPFLLVGGTADPFWDAEGARRLTAHVLEIDGADHGMYVPGALTDTIAVLARVVTGIDEFLDTIGWPQR